MHENYRLLNEQAVLHQSWWDWTDGNDNENNVIAVFDKNINLMSTGIELWIEII